MKVLDSDLQTCLSLQPRNQYIPANQATKKLAEYLLTLLNNDDDKAKVILRELVRDNPRQSIDWYYEKAILHLLKQQKVKRDRSN